MKKYFILSALLCTQFAFAQLPPLEWARNFSADSTNAAFCLAYDATGNVYTSGRSLYPTDIDPGTGTVNLPAGVWISKLNSAGDFQSGFGIAGGISGGIPTIHVTSMVTDASANIIVVGTFINVPGNSIDFNPGAGVVNLPAQLNYTTSFIAKYSSTGVFQWAYSFQNTQQLDFSMIETDAVGNLFLYGRYYGSPDMDPGAGVFMLPSMSSAAGFLLKLNASGQFVWVREFGTNGVYPLDLVVDGAGNLFLSGEYGGLVDFDPGPGVYSVTGNGTNAFVLKFNAAGLFQWVYATTATSFLRGGRIAMDGSGNIYMQGMFSGMPDFDPGPANYQLVSINANPDAYLLKLNSSGGFLWAVGWGGSWYDVAGNVHVLPNGNVLCIGSFLGLTNFHFPTWPPIQMNSQGYDMYFLTLSPTGGFVSVSSLTGPNGEAIYGSELMADGSLLLTGYYSLNTDFDPGPGFFTLPVVGGMDAYTMKLGLCAQVSTSFSHSSCNPYTWNGITYSTSGSYVQFLNSAAGCDSVVTLNYTRNTSATQLNIIACQTHTYNGSTYTSSGNYTHHFTNVAGCDSAVTLHLTLGQPQADTIVAQTCSSYSLNGTVYTSSGTYVQHLSTALGCDSSLVLQLSVHSPTSSSLTVSSCGTYSLNNLAYLNSGTFTQHLTNAAGCDSTLTLHLTVNGPSTGHVYASTCDSLQLNGVYYSTTGNHIQHLTNAHGCDSTLTLHLSVHAPALQTLNVSACDSFALNGVTYTASGTYTQNLTSAAGCDSTLTLQLTLIATTSGSLTLHECNSAFTLNGITYTSSGNYMQSLTNAAGCDSLLSLQLTLQAVDTAVVLTSASSAQAQATAATFQWLDCNNNFAAVPGATQDTFTAPISGYYAVLVQQGSCTDTSACYLLTLPSARDDAATLDFILFPNPGKGAIICFASAVRPLAISLIDLQGREQSLSGFTCNKTQSGFEGCIEFMPELCSGFYFLRYNGMTRPFVVNRE